jgi:hypothetical protein
MRRRVCRPPEPYLPTITVADRLALGIQVGVEAGIGGEDDSFGTFSLHAR